jgi:hypothetical protein
MGLFKIEQSREAWMRIVQGNAWTILSDEPSSINT